MPPGEFELVGYGEHIDNSSVQQETKNLIGQLRLVSNSKALDFKIRGHRCKNNMLVFFARLMSLVMMSIWRQCKQHQQTKYVSQNNVNMPIKKVHKTVDVVDFNKYASSLGLLDGITERLTKHQTKPEDEYVGSDPKMLEFMSSQKALELQAMPITPLETSTGDPDTEASSVVSDNSEDQDLFLPEVGEALLLTSYTLVEVLKVVYVMRDFAFERIMGYALICLKSAYSPW